MPHSDVMKRCALTGLLVCVTAVWGWTFTVVRDAVLAYGVLAFLALRFALAAAALGPLAARRMNRRTLRAGLGIGAVLGVGYLFQTFGLKHTTPTNCGLVTGLFIVFVPLFDRVLHGIGVPRAMWLAVGASLAGMVLLVGQSPKELRTGDLLTVVAAAAYGLHISLLSRYSAGHDPGALTMMQMLTIALASAGAWPVFEPLAVPPAEVWWALGVAGVLASAAAFYVQTFVQARLSALRTGIVLSMEPLFAAIFGYLLAGDRLTAIQIAGAVLVFGAVVMTEVVQALRKMNAPAKAS